VSADDAQPSPLEVVYDLARLLSELDLIMNEARGSSEAVADPALKAAFADLARDIEARSVPVAMSFFRTCHFLAGGDDAVPPDGPWPGLGLRIARSLDGFDPRIQGEEAARARLREAVRDRGVSP